MPLAAPDPAVNAVPDFSTVTELAGTEVTGDQIRRLYNRYVFASTFCDGKDVIELACGTGQGLGYLAKKAKSIVGGDIDEGILETARRRYGDRISLRKLDATALPFPDGSFDVIILYEAIYYLPDARKFAAEARRVLRPGGVLLICTANKDLPDFNPSPYSHAYFNPPEFVALLRPLGFTVECLGEDEVDTTSVRQRVIRLIKRIAVALHLVPRTMKGKKLLKRLFFGKLQQMPPEVVEGMAPLAPPVPIPTDRPDTLHRVIHCVARRSNA
ncbi:MAG: class I SAM-dependent methyltransferase [Planctomycetota bacterium]|nr:class I SAM-dependent methyltransferase [Planctomycetota bacterium]